MQTGHQLRCLFAIILLHCHPIHPHTLWDFNKEKLCDNLLPRLIALGHLNPTDEDVFDYGLHLIQVILIKAEKSLSDYPNMPLPQQEWELTRSWIPLTMLKENSFSFTAQEAVKRLTLAMPSPLPFVQKVMSFFVLPLLPSLPFSSMVAGLLILASKSPSPSMSLPLAGSLRMMICMVSSSVQSSSYQTKLLCSTVMLSIAPSKTF